MYFLIGISFILLIKIKLACDQQLDSNDQSLGLTQCQNCIIVSDNTYCQKLSQIQPGQNTLTYYSQYQQNQGFQYCHNGIISNFASCNQNTCIDGYQWSILDQKCIQKQVCVQKIIDQNLQIYQCQFCNLVLDVSYCNYNSCSSSQYYSIKNGSCYEYCTDGKIAQSYSQCNTQNVQCIDGYQLNSQNQCEKIICSAKISTSDHFLAFLQQCPNCSIAQSKYNCQNTCLPSSELQYYNLQQQQCMVYCGNGIIAFDKKSCPSSNLCVDRAQWSDQEKQCKISDSQSTSTQISTQLLIVIIGISLFAVFIIIILASCFVALRKFKVFDKNYQKIQEIINNLESTQKIDIDKIKNEIDSLKIIRNTNNQLLNNQIEIDFNQKSQEDFALQEQNDSQNTMKQLENNLNLQQQYSQQNYQENPLIKNQLSQQKDIKQL